jgi:hypothetical protein
MEQTKAPGLEVKRPNTALQTDERRATVLLNGR